MKRILSLAFAVIMVLTAFPVMGFAAMILPAETVTKNSSSSSTVKYTTTETLNMRKSASSSSTLIVKVAKGATVSSAGKKSGDYTYVSYTKSGKIYKGWVLTKYLKKANSTSSVNYQTTDTLNMRKSASSSSSLIVKVPKGATVSSTGKKSGDYTYVSYTKSGKTYKGWVLTKYLKKAGSSASLTKERNILYSYLKANYKLADVHDFPFNTKKNSVISAKVSDFDGDGHCEMVAVVISNVEVYSIALKYFRIVSGKAKLINTSISMSLEMGGNWDASVCMTVSGKNVYVYMFKNGYGGSNSLDDYYKFSVSGGKLKRVKNFSYYIFPRYDREEMEESVSKKMYTSYSSFKKDLTANGFDVKNHGYTCKSSSHVFSFYVSFDGYGEVFFKDNTSVKSKMK